MMKTKTKWMGLLVATFLAFSAPVVFADNGNGGNLTGDQSAVSDDQSSPGQGDHDWKQGHWGRHGRHMGGRLFHKLNLTDDQKKQLKDIFQKQREAKKTTFEQMKADKEALTNELLQTTPDMNKINDLKSKLETIGAQMLDSRINSDLEVKKILTPEQFGKYLELQKKMFSGRFHKHSDFRGHCRHHHRHHRHHGYRGYQDDDGNQ